MARTEQSTCGKCDLVFVSVEAFDFHRTGSFEKQTRRCLSVEEMRAKRMTQDGQGRWQLPARMAANRRRKQAAARKAERKSA